MKAITTIAVAVTALIQPLVCSGETRIPVERNHHFMVVTVGTPAGPRRFAVDTGAGICVIPRHTADEIGCECVDSMTVVDSQGDRTRHVMATLPELNFGGLPFNGIKALVLDDENVIFKCFPLDGIIGTNVLKNIAVRFSTSEIVIGVDAAEVGATKAHGAGRIYGFNPRKEHPGTPWVALKLMNGKHGAWHAFMVDTGAESICYRDLKNLKEKGITSLLRSTVGYSSSIGVANMEHDTDTIHYGIIPQVRFGHTTIANVAATSAIHGVIGTDILTHGDLVLDFPHRKAYFIPSETGEMARTELKSITPYFSREKGYVVGAVWDDTLEGVRPGDRIVEVNGVSTDGWTLCDALNYSGKAEECVVETSVGRCRIDVRTMVKP